VRHRPRIKEQTEKNGTRADVRAGAAQEIRSRPRLTLQISKDRGEKCRCCSFEGNELEAALPEQNPTGIAMKRIQLLAFLLAIVVSRLWRATDAVAQNAGASLSSEDETEIN
jgi:hypothetical protein